VSEFYDTFGTFSMAGVVNKQSGIVGGFGRHPLHQDGKKEGAVSIGDKNEGGNLNRNAFGHYSIEGQVYDRDESETLPNPQSPQTPTKIRRERNFDKTHYNGREEKLGLGINHMTPDNTTDHGMGY